MSSWLAQSIDISLSQKPDLPDPTPVSPAEKFPFLCTLSSETMPSCVRSLFAKNPSQSQRSPVFRAKLQLATPKERVMLFGSSPLSQFSSTIRTTTSSPWSLFSQGHAKSSLRELPAKIHPQAQTFTHPKQLEMRVSQQFTPPETPLQTPHPQKHPELPLSKEFCPASREKASSPSSETKALKDSFISEKKVFVEAQKQQESPLRTPPPLSKTFSEHQDSSDHSSKENPHPQQKALTIQKRKARATAVVPLITPPTIGIFSLSYLLTKQGILSDFSAYSSYKENLETTQNELTMLHQQRIEQVQKLVAKAKTTRFWDSLASIVATIVPWMEMGVAVTIIAMGGGILSWCALFAALIMIVISLLEAFDGWRAIAKHLPGNDLEKKMRYLGYVKLALTLFSCMLSLSSLYVAKLGMSPLLEGVVKSISPALSGMLGLTQGIALSLQASSQKLRARCTQIDSHIECINWERDEYLLRAEQLLDSLQTSFEQLSETLQLQREIDQTFVEALR